jgi:hypothetical protein
VLWVLDHEADIDADFLACYGIDLATYPMPGPRYLALAYRLAAYQGVMAGRVAKEKEQQATEPAARPAERAPGGANEVSLSAFRAQFPGLVSTAKSG